ncbi:MAG TPA: Nramp family divalent metal transporter, partial [Lacipirellulaceae bacterium]|nr:Nramp family divalent metal transporter [Lacipirellulaceae bacterium]
MSDAARDGSLAPHPGSPVMPRWDMGELRPAPPFTLRSWAMLLGPGLVMGGAAIGGGEWLAGPLTTARYGGGILWLATLSILGQVLYNIEISRYTLYCGEPIFTGKFRLLPGPLFWLVIYLFLDFGSVLPYLVASAATPLAAVIVGEVPVNDRVYEVLGGRLSGESLLNALKYVAFFLVLLPMVFGGKAYNAMKAIMQLKIVVVLGFLLLVAFCYSTSDTWYDILTGFIKFGSVPVQAGTPGGPPGMENIFVALWEGRPLPVLDLSMVATLGALAAVSGNGGLTNTTISTYTREQGWGMGQQVGAVPSVFGDRDLKLSHTGMVFPINRDSVARFRRWYQVVLRDQLVV